MISRSVRRKSPMSAWRRSTSSTKRLTERLWLSLSAMAAAAVTAVGDVTAVEAVEAATTPAAATAATAATAAAAPVLGLAAAAAAAAAGTVGYGPAGAGFGLANESASETGYSAQRNILDARELRFFEP